MSDTPALILIIDDQAQNLQILSTTLRSAGYQVAAANSGEKALKILEKLQPDLVLCDVVMPEMDGYEVCQRLRSRPQTQDLPLIFLTAQTDSEHILKGFEAGAVDYVTKPFNPGELLARAKTHIELKQARDTIMAYTRELESLNHEKNQFLGIAAHDLKNPLGTVLVSAEMVEIKAGRIAKEDLVDYMQIMQKDARRMLMIVNNLLDVNQIESGELELHSQSFNLAETAQALLKQYREQAGCKEISLELEASNQELLWRSDPQILYQILDNLLSNAIKYSPRGKTVTLRVQPQAEELRIEIQDQGPGFTAADREKMFQKFARLSARPTAGESSTGLGLSIVRLLCDALKIQLQCESEEGQGACFKLDLPKTI